MAQGESLIVSPIVGGAAEPSISSISLDECLDLHKKYYNENIGTLEYHEISWVAGTVHERKPGIFLELGVASGLTTGIIGRVLSQIGQGRIIGLDAATQFYGDKTKQVGFLVDDLIEGSSRPRIAIKAPAFMAQIPEFLGPDDRIDLALIDGDHQHPWTTLDMLCLLPFMNPGRGGIFVHDVNLYRGFHRPDRYAFKGDTRTEIGPKFLIDQLPGKSYKLIAFSRPNIALVETAGDYREFTDALCAALFIPWRLREKVRFSYLAKLHRMLEIYWSQEVVRVFERAVEKYG
jgi:hypothetical protein